MKNTRLQAYRNEISLALAALEDRHYQEGYAHLERAHILGQTETIKHTYAHWLMLKAALSQRDLREILGQMPRIVASVLFSRIWVPVGNTGRAGVSGLKPMPLPDDLRDLVS